MTIKHLTTLIIGLFFCFCLLGKQVNQFSPELIEGSSIQEVVPESFSHDNALDAHDDVILTLLAPLFSLALAILLVTIVRLYSQPLLFAPKRPPRSN
jgi:hypothetical protein